MPETTHFYGITLQKKHLTETALRKDKLNRRVVAKGVFKLIQHVSVKRLSIWIYFATVLKLHGIFLPFIFIFRYHS